MSDARPTIIIDSREQRPLDFGDWPTERAGLDTGDYSLRGFTDLIAIERKSLPDLVMCCGRERDRFMRELNRLRAYRYRAVVVEATYKKIQGGKWRSQLKPAHVIGSIASWGAKFNIEFVFAGDPEGAAVWTVNRLRKIHEHLREYAKRFN
jgi:ERCC4-type nuclease